MSTNTVRLNLDTRAIILFDGVCNLCNASVNFVLDRDTDAYFRFGALQSEEGRRMLNARGMDAEYLESIVLIEDGIVYRESDAALRIARKLGGPWRFLYSFRWIPRAIRDGLYGWIARNRYDWFGKRDVCRIPTPELRTRFL